MGEEDARFGNGPDMKAWCGRAMRSHLEPAKRVARMLVVHEGRLMNWFRASGELWSGSAEGLNDKIRGVTWRSHGFRSDEAMELALYHDLGRRPEPEVPQHLCRGGRVGFGSVSSQPCRVAATHDDLHSAGKAARPRSVPRDASRRPTQLGSENGAEERRSYGQRRPMVGPRVTCGHPMPGCCEDGRRRTAPATRVAHHVE